MKCEFLSEWMYENGKVHYCEMRMECICPGLCKVCELKEKQAKLYRRLLAAKERSNAKIYNSFTSGD